MFIRNAWYVACALSELEAQQDRPLGRTICHEKMAFFRATDDQVAAVEDYCPHRGAPMSLGRVCQGQLRCGYHGLLMNGQGQVVDMPGQRVRGFPSVKSYPVRLRYGFVWVWPGDPNQADDALLPQFDFLDHQIGRAHV